MAGSWHSVTSAVELGHLQVPGKAVTDPPGPVLDDSQEIVVPAYKGGFLIGSMGPENARLGFAAKVQRVLPSVEIPNTVVLDDSALSPNAGAGVPSLGVSLGSARFRCTLQAQHPEGIAHIPELQPSGEPKRIWNRVSLGLLDCGLDQSGIHRVAVTLRAEQSKPEECRLVPEIPDPNMRTIEGFSPEGLPTERHTALRHTHYAPAGTLLDSRPVAPRLRVPLPSPPRMR